MALNKQLTNTELYFDWTEDHEQILFEWADKAMCYRWLHSRSNALYNYLNTWYTIPVIVISTLTGTANFAQDRVPIEYQHLFVMVVGGFNILAGIITTIQQFLKITQLNESHRVAAIAWDKFYRNIKVELARHPDERTPVVTIIKIYKEEFDRLMETSPIIPDKILEQFKTEIMQNEKKNELELITKNKNYITSPSPKIIKPEICGELISTQLYKNQWTPSENKNKQLKKIATNEQKHDTIEDVELNFTRTDNKNIHIETLKGEISNNVVKEDIQQIIDSPV